MTTTAQTNGRGQETYRDFSQMNFEGTIKRPERREEGISGATDYSAFAHKQAEVLHTLKGLVMMAEFENEKERLLVLRLFRIFERDWTAPINNRTAGILEAEAGADKWRQRMAADDAAVEGTPDADDLLAQWSTGAKMLAEALVQKRLHGLQHVRATLRKETIDPILLVPRVRTARELLDQCREDMRQARYQAASLPPAASEYFWNRVTALQISIERSTDIALGIPVVDYLQVKEDLARGVHVALVADRMPWSYQEIADRAFSSMGGSFLEYLSIWQIGMWPWDRQKPKAKRGLFGFGPKDEDEDQGGDEDYEDSQPRRFGQSGGRQRKQRKGKK